MRSPPSADSKRNAPPSERSFAKAETGVSRSASRSRMTGTSRVAFGAVIATFVPSLRKQIALARPRDEGSWCHPICRRIAATASASPTRERPLITAGCRPRLIVAFRRGVSREPFASRSPSRFSPSPVRFPVRATYSFPLERRYRHRTERAGFWPSLRPGPVAQGRSVQLISEELTSVWSPPWSHGGAVHAAQPPPAQGAGNPPRAADGHRLHGHREAAALPHRPAPPGIHLLGPPRDRHPGPGAVPA